MAHPFHLAFPVQSLDESRRFYADLLGCSLGRAGDDWQDIDFFGSQIVAHVVDGGSHLQAVGVNQIQGNDVPIPHFGAVLSMDEWVALVARLQEEGADLVMAPHVRYPGEINEQASVFVRDPSGNVIEFKAIADPSHLFTTGE